jgi:hypothetical protein
VYKIQPNHGPTFKVFCDQTTFGGGWVVIQRHLQSFTSFQRTLKEYENGFGNLSEEFWIGNANIHRLTGSPHNLLVQLNSFDNTTAHAQYESFAVSNESTGYALSVDGYSGSAGDALSNLTNVPFSIKSFSNSSQESSSGWWHENSARTTDLNAPSNDTINGPPQRVWQGFGGSHSLTATEMKIKPERGEY